jgi:hypothetical protein
VLEGDAASRFCPVHFEARPSSHSNPVDACLAYPPSSIILRCIFSSFTLLLAIHAFSPFPAVDCTASHSLLLHSALCTLPTRRRDQLEMARRDPVKLRVANQKAYLWDLNGSSLCSLRLEFDETRRARLAHTNCPGGCCLPTDVQYLRVQHHICGVLSGTLPQVTQQNVFLGLPLVLMPEEVVLLVRNGQYWNVNRALINIAALTLL